MIAGSLIQQLNDTTSLRGITCGAPDSDGKLYLASILSAGGAAGKTLSCTLTGSALDQMSKLRLEDTTGATIADAPVTAGADPTTATAIFASGDVPKLTGSSYELYSVDSSSTATDLKQALSVVPVPTATAVTAAVGATQKTAASDLQAAFILTITGTNLDQVTQVQLVNSSGAVTLGTLVGPASAGTVAANFPAKSVAAAAATYTIQIGAGPSKTPYNLGTNTAAELVTQ